MNIEKVIASVIVALVQSLAVTIAILKQIDIKNFSLKIKFNIIIFIYCIFGFLFIPNQLRFIISIIIMSMAMRFILKIKNKNVVLYSFNTVITMTIGEIITSFSLVLMGFDSTKIVNDPIYNLLANFLISLFTIVIISVPFILRLIKKEIKLFDKNKNLINYLYIFLFILYLILSKNGLEFILKSNYYINIIFIIIVIIVIIIIIKNESKYDQLNEQNKQMLNYVAKYEKIITDQGKANHEFRNQLMVIRGYAQMNSPKLIEYLDSIVDDTKKTHSSYLISQLNNFPDGGIKGLLYYKLSIMEDENIKYEINVESGIKTKLKSLDTVIYKNITKILGVLLDNAIDASKNAENKKAVISVIKESSKVIFNISNTYKGKIDVSKIGTGYTTKGRNHGYGLRLVNDIIKENNCLDVKSEVNDDYYTTSLFIEGKTKKKK